jgi:hypothetical protein
MTEYRIWPTTDGPAGSFTDGQPVSQGTEFIVTANGWVTKIWYWRATSAMGTTPPQGQIFLVTSASTGTPIDSPKTFPAPTGLGWQSVTLDTPIAVIPGEAYRAVIYHPNGEYTATPGNNYWNAGGPGEFGIVNGILTARAAADSNGGQSTFKYGSGIQYPDSSFNSGNYWVDLSVSNVVPVTGPTNPGAFLEFLR